MCSKFLDITQACKHVHYLNALTWHFDQESRLLSIKCQLSWVLIAYRLWRLMPLVFWISLKDANTCITSMLLCDTSIKRVDFLSMKGQLSWVLIAYRLWWLVPLVHPRVQAFSSPFIQSFVWMVLFKTSLRSCFSISCFLFEI